MFTMFNNPCRERERERTWIGCSRSRHHGWCSLRPIFRQITSQHEWRRGGIARERGRERSVQQGGKRKKFMVAPWLGEILAVGRCIGAASGVSRFSGCFSTQVVPRWMDENLTKHHFFRVFWVIVWFLGKKRQSCPVPKYRVREILPDKILAAPPFLFGSGMVFGGSRARHFAI